MCYNVAVGGLRALLYVVLLIFTYVDATLFKYKLHHIGI